MAHSSAIQRHRPPISLEAVVSDKEGGETVLVADEKSQVPVSRGIRGSFFPNLFFLLRLRFADSLCE